MDEDNIWNIRIYVLLIFLVLFSAVLIVLNAETQKSAIPSAGEYQVYPDPVRTPGAINPNITQENIDETICHPDYRTGTVRPPKEYTAKLKRKQIEEYGYKDKNPRSYQEDHLIPLWIRGHPTDPKNLWPQPIYIEMGAKSPRVVQGRWHATHAAGRLVAGPLRGPTGQGIDRRSHPASHVLLASGDAGRTDAGGVQELVGHQSLAMTQRYSHLTPASLDTTIRLLDNRPQSRSVGDSWETPKG